MAKINKSLRKKALLAHDKLRKLIYELEKNNDPFSEFLIDKIQKWAAY